MSWFVDLFVPTDDLVKQAEGTDRRIAEHNARTKYFEKLSPENKEISLGHYSEVATDTASIKEQVDDAFVAGATEGLTKAQNFTQGLINKVTFGLVGFLPAWLIFVVVVVGLGYVAWSFGVFGLVKRRIAKTS